ncbi:MAG TPA: flavodoxin family protein [Thermoleophilia bacterium]
MAIAGGTMKVVLFDGSARPGGSITALLAGVAAELEAVGVETEALRLERNPYTGCTVCGQCAHGRDLSCSHPPEDGLRRCVRKLLAADGLVIGSPAYSAKASPAAQALMVRASAARRAGGDRPLACKVAAAVVDTRSVGAGGTHGRLVEWFRANEMIVVGADDRGRGTGAATEGDGAGSDAFAARLGRCLAWTLRRLHA